MFCRDNQESVKVFRMLNVITENERLISKKALLTSSDVLYKYITFLNCSLLYYMYILFSPFEFLFSKEN